MQMGPHSQGAPQGQMVAAFMVFLPEMSWNVSGTFIRADAGGGGDITGKTENMRTRKKGNKRIREHGNGGIVNRQQVTVRSGIRLLGG